MSITAFAQKQFMKLQTPPKEFKAKIAFAVGEQDVFEAFNSLPEFNRLKVRKAAGEVVRKY